MAQLNSKKVCGPLIDRFGSENAALAGVLGVGLSYPALYYVQANFAALGSAANFMPTPTVLVSALLCALLTGLLASLWPAWRAAALMPKETLR